MPNKMLLEIEKTVNDMTAIVNHTVASHLVLDVVVYNSDDVALSEAL